jgi:type IV secretory pathway VirB2 component (pilin)
MNSCDRPVSAKIRRNFRARERPNIFTSAGSTPGTVDGLCSGLVIYTARMLQILPNKKIVLGGPAKSI